MKKFSYSFIFLVNLLFICNLIFLYHAHAFEIEKLDPLCLEQLADPEPHLLNMTDFIQEFNKAIENPEVKPEIKSLIQMEFLTYAHFIEIDRTYLLDFFSNLLSHNNFKNESTEIFLKHFGLKIIASTQGPLFESALVINNPELITLMFDEASKKKLFSKIKTWGVSKIRLSIAEWRIDLDHVQSQNIDILIAKHYDQSKFQISSNSESEFVTALYYLFYPFAQAKLTSLGLHELETLIPGFSKSSVIETLLYLGFQLDFSARSDFYWVREKNKAVTNELELKNALNLLKSRTDVHIKPSLVLSPVNFLTTERRPAALERLYQVINEIK